MSTPIYVNAANMQCGYRSKRCEFPRSFKRNGELHRFCDYHRTKANTNQRKVDQRRREMAQKQNSDAASSPTSAQDSSFLPDIAWYDDLDPQDLDYLNRLLSTQQDEDITPGSGDPSDSAKP